MTESVGIRLIAPAKLTLSLRITGVRRGGRYNGLHEIDATMVSLNLCDELILKPGASRSVEVVDEMSPHSHSAIPADTLVQDAMKLAKMTGYVVLRKRIPLEAGLGGGSSDAAAILRWANWAIRSTTPTVTPPITPPVTPTITSPISVARACQIGADVGFCLSGGRARVRGIGEKIKPLKYKQEQYTLLLPPFGLSTKRVYKAWDRLASSDSGVSDPDRLESDGADLDDQPVNDLEQAAISLEPELAKWRDALAEQTNQKPILAGSGSGWFVKGHYPDVLFEEIRGLPVTTTPSTNVSQAAV